MIEDAQAYRDVPVYPEHPFVRANMVEARFLYHKAMRVLAITITEVIQKLTTIKVHSLAKDPTII